MLFRVVKNDAYRMPHTGANAAHAVAQVHAVVALRSLYRAVMDGKGYGIALPKRHDFSTALHGRPLLGEHKLAASEILARLREEDRNLDWECEITVEVLVQAIEVTRNILQ